MNRIAAPTALHSPTLPPSSHSTLRSQFGTKRRFPTTALRHLTFCAVKCVNNPCYDCDKSMPSVQEVPQLLLKKASEVSAWLGADPSATEEEP